MIKSGAIWPRFLYGLGRASLSCRRRPLSGLYGLVCHLPSAIALDIDGSGRFQGNGIASLGQWYIVPAHLCNIKRAVRRPLRQAEAQNSIRLRLRRRVCGAGAVRQGTGGHPWDDKGSIFPTVRKAMILAVGKQTAGRASKSGLFRLFKNLFCLS